jgi:hypothetical protein
LNVVLGCIFVVLRWLLNAKDCRGFSPWQPLFDPSLILWDWS